MTKKIKVVTIQEVITWLKRKRTASFPFSNTPKGCLFTQFMRDYTGNPKCLIGYGGDFFASQRTALHESIKDVIPFHNAFWNHKWKTCGTVTRKFAIARLEKMLTIGQE